MDENPYRAPQDDGNAPAERKRFSMTFYLILALLLGAFLINFVFDLLFVFMSRRPGP